MCIGPNLSAFATSVYIFSGRSPSIKSEVCKQEERARFVAVP